MRLPGLWATESLIVSEPAEGVQTLSEHDALSWLQCGKADGAVDLCSVGHEVLFVRRQKVHVVPLPLNLLSLQASSNKEKTTAFKRISKKFEKIRYGFATQTIILFPSDWNSFWTACKAKKLLQFTVLWTPLFLDLLICSMKTKKYIYIVVCKVYLMLKACKSRSRLGFVPFWMKTCTQV